MPRKKNNTVPRAIRDEIAEGAFGPDYPPVNRMCAALRLVGIPHVRRNKVVWDEPDIHIKEARMVVCVYGEALHRRYPGAARRMPPLWAKKALKQTSRDIHIRKAYSSRGWMVVRLWASETLWPRIGERLLYIMRAFEKRTRGQA